MKKEKNLWMARIAIVAALYVVLTLISYPFSYGIIQFRISEALMLLCCYDKRYTWSMVVGCIVSNLFSFDLIDCLFGTLATLLACITMVLLKKKFIASFAPAVFNGIIIGLELYFVIDSPLILSIIGVAIGELVVVVILGNVIFHYIEKDKKQMDIKYAEITTTMEVFKPFSKTDSRSEILENIALLAETLFSSSWVKVFFKSPIFSNIDTKFLSHN